MTMAERVDYLVRELACDNAAAFAEKCGVPGTSLSKWRHGARTPSRTAVEKILAAYPEVRREWLAEGKGKPFLGTKIVPKAAEGRIMDRLDALEKKLEEVLSIVSRYR